MVRTSGARSSEARAKISLLCWMLAPANTRPSADSSSRSSCSSAKPSRTSASTSGSRSSTSRPRLSARSARSAAPPWRPSMISARPDRPSTVARGSGVSLTVPGARPPAGRRPRRDGLVALGHHPVDLVDQLLEVRRPAAARPGQRVAQVGADPAGVGAQHQDPVREQHRVLDVVGDHDHGLGREALALPQLEQLAAQVLRGQHVQRAERLVHEQGGRLDDQRPGEADPLPHPARQLLGVGPLVAVQADQVDGAQRPLRPRPGRDAARLEARARRSAARSATAAARRSGRPWWSRGWRRSAAPRGTAPARWSAASGRRCSAAASTCRCRCGRAARRTRPRPRPG